MAKIVLSQKILGMHFGESAIQHALYFIEKKGMDKDEVMKDLTKNMLPHEFVELYRKYFGDELILRF